MRVSAADIWRCVGEESLSPPSMEDLANFWVPCADGGRGDFSSFIGWATSTPLVRKTRVYEGLQKPEQQNKIEYTLWMASRRACEIARELQKKGYQLDSQLVSILRQEPQLKRLVSGR
jgi:hypothetical protein